MSGEPGVLEPGCLPSLLSPALSVSVSLSLSLALSYEGD